MGNKKHVYVAMLISFMAVVLNSFISLYLTPLITNSVGIEAYGFVSLAKSFTSYATIVMTALNSYAARYMSVSYLRNEKGEYAKYFNTVLFGDIAIAGVILLVGVFGIFRLEYILNIPASLIRDVKILFLLTFVTFYISTITTAYAATAYVKDCLEVYNTSRVLSYIVEIGTLLFLFWLFDAKVWYVGIATVAAASVVFYASKKMTLKRIQELEISLRLFDMQSMKKLIVNGFWNSANSVGNALNSGLDLLISNLMLSAVSMGQISIAKNISGLIYTLYLTISQPFQPNLIKKYSGGDKEGLIKELKYAMRVSGVITNTVFAGFCILGTSFYNLWIPNQNIVLVHSLTVIAMLPCISEGCVYPLYYIYTLTVKNKIPCIITILGGVSNVFGMYFLIKNTNLGAYSIVVTTAVVMNFINFVTNPLYMCHCLKISKRTFYPNIFLNVLCCVVAILTMKGIVLIYPIAKGWESFAVHVIVCGGIGLLAQMMIAFKPSDSKKLLTIIKTKSKK